MNDNNGTNETPDPHRAAQELRSMLDVLLAAGTTDVSLYDDTLEDYAATMLEKVSVVLQWFEGGGVERIMGGNGTDPEPQEHEKTLPKVINDLMTAVDLCKTLKVFLAETHEDYGMTAGSVVEQIERHIRRAWDLVDYADMERERRRDASEAPEPNEAEPADEPELCDPGPRKFDTIAGITLARGETRWQVSDEHSPRTIDDLSFTAREECGDDMLPSMVWWRVTPADTDYNSVHKLHGRSLAFQFLDLVNHPERDADMSDMTLMFIANGMARARSDWRQEAVQDGFWHAIGEYILCGTCER